MIGIDKADLANKSYIAYTDCSPWGHKESDMTWHLNKNIAYVEYK